MIQIIVPNNLTLNSILDSSGNNAIKQDLGSGGGSGGSIQLTIGSLSGNGTIDISGGDGSSPEGGGGSGGRVRLYFLKAIERDIYPYMSLFWTGDLKIDGGKGAATPSV